MKILIREVSSFWVPYRSAVDPNCGRCEKRYRRRYYSFAVPTTVPPTLAGAAGFALDSYVPEGYN